MQYNYAKLTGRIIEKMKTRKAFSMAMGISEKSISQKLTGKTGWKQSEIFKACNLLDIKPNEIPDYFFTLEVQ